MRSGRLIRGSTAALVALLAALLVATLVQSPPAAGQARSPLGPSGPAPSPTDTSPDTGPPAPTPTPTPTDTPTPTPTSTLPPDLLVPDVVSIAASDFEINPTRSGRRLRFTSALGNVGTGPLEVRPNRLYSCPEGQRNSAQVIYRDANANATYNWRRDTQFVRNRAGCMVYHPKHEHWHFKASASYTLLDPLVGDAVVTARRKVSFCLRDTVRVPDWFGTWPGGGDYGSCTRTKPQGISPGWMDVYQSFLAGQSLLLPEGLPDGVYCLRTVVDPLDQLLESNNDNNSSLREIGIIGNRVRPRPMTICS